MITSEEARYAQKRDDETAALNTVVSTLGTIVGLRGGSFTGDEITNGTYIENEDGDPEFVKHFTADDAVGAYPVGS